MNLRSIKRPEARVNTSYLSRYNIKAWGSDNIAPHMWLLAIANSPVGTACLTRYARFIEGNGIESVELSDVEVNRYGDTLDDIYKAVCEDMARLGGFAIHVNYNAECRISEIQHVPFETCRLEEDDDAGYIAKIVTHPDWSQQGKTRNGKRLTVNDSNITRYDVFNPRKDVIMAQVMKAGGLDKWNGQILWVSMDGRTTYPVPKYDAVITELSTDEGLSNLKCRNVRNNFLGSGILWTYHKEGAEGSQTGDGFADDLAGLQGDTNACKWLNVNLAANEQQPVLTAFPTSNYDKEFTATEESVTSRIYEAFEQEGFLCIANGKVGFGGDVISDVYNHYSSLVSKEQRTIVRGMQRVLDLWHEPLPAKMAIDRLKFVREDETTGETTD